MRSQIYPCLWFSGNAREEPLLQLRFNHSKVLVDTPVAVQFESAGQKLMYLNGGPGLIFNPSVSFFVVSKTEEEEGFEPHIFNPYYQLVS